MNEIEPCLIIPTRHILEQTWGSLYSLRILFLGPLVPGAEMWRHIIVENCLIVNSQNVARIQLRQYLIILCKLPKNIVF